jgi:hypothetical protein
VRPVVLEGYGSETSFFRNNLLWRGGTSGIKTGVEVHGRYQIFGNHISDFDEANAVAVAADPFGRASEKVYRGNVIENCTNVAVPAQQGAGTPTAGNKNNSKPESERGVSPRLNR